MVYKSACVCKLCSITQKGVRSNFSRWFTRLYNSWMMIKIDANYEILIIDYWNFGLSMNALTDHVADSQIGTMTVKSCKHQGVCVAIIKVKIYTKTNKEKFECCGSTLVLGKWLPREHIGVRHICCRRTMVLGKQFAAWALWCGKKTWEKTRHLEDRMLFDVTEEKTFN